MRRFCILIAIGLTVLMGNSFAFGCSTLDQEIANIEASTKGKHLGYLLIDVVQKNESEVALYAVTQVATNGFVVLFKAGCAVERYSISKASLQPVIPPGEWLKLTRELSPGDA